MAPASGESSAGGLSAPSYRDSGVDVDAAADVKSRIADLVSRTHGPQVLGGVGGFGALYALSGFRDPVLVSSTDGVGTKSKVAAAMGRYDGLGEDVVNACVNDVIVCGATPAYFLDYIGVGELDAAVVEDLLSGMVRACETAGCALIGGETAQMPGVYAEGDFRPRRLRRGRRGEGRDTRPGRRRDRRRARGAAVERPPHQRLRPRPPRLRPRRRPVAVVSPPARAGPHAGRGASGAAPLVRVDRPAGAGRREEHRPRHRRRADREPPARPAGRRGGLSRQEGMGRALDILRHPVRRRDNRRRDVPCFNMGLGMVLVCDGAKASALAAELPGAKSSARSPPPRASPE